MAKQCAQGHNTDIILTDSIHVSGIRIQNHFKELLASIHTHIHAHTHAHTHTHTHTKYCDDMQTLLCQSVAFTAQQHYQTSTFTIGMHVDCFFQLKIVACNPS